MIWRWHFYAGLFVMPFILMLSVTGALYLFKPQVERWEERAFQNLPTSSAASPDRQRDAALAAFPGAQFQSYRLPERSGDAAMIHLAMGQERAMRDVFVSPQGRVLGSFDPDARLMTLDKDIHGSVLAGRIGDWLIELAGSWAIVMLLTGLYLWWPSGQGIAGVLWPRLRQGKRIFWRDLHAVTGFWVSGLALILLVTGLPWAGVWGSAFKAARTELGLTKGPSDWKVGRSAAGDSDHAGHRDMTMAMPKGHAAPAQSLTAIVAKAQAQHLAFPVLVSPSADATDWIVKSESQNRPLRVTLSYDDASGALIARKDFASQHPIDRVVGYGIAWHEGHLFGWINQLVGVLTAVAIMTLAVSGFVIWRRRKPADRLGAPPLPPVPVKMRGVVAIILLLAALLPLLAASLILLWIIERLVLPRLPGVATWLGLAPVTDTQSLIEESKS